jgi:hypothetical protein
MIVPHLYGDGGALSPPNWSDAQGRHTKRKMAHYLAGGRMA